MAAHRYWRINIRSNSYGPGYPTLSEVAFATVKGGPTATGNGAAIASSVYQGQGASNACDGNPGTFWAAQPIPSWWGYDFGAGNATEIREVRITSRADSQDAANQAPRDWDLDWSDDGAAWTTAQSYTSAAWAPGATQAFAVASAHRFWRMLQYSDTLGMAEVQFRTTPGTPLPFSGGAASARTTYGGAPGPSDPSKAADGDTGTFYSATGSDGVQSQWWQYDYGPGAGLAVREISITSRSDGYYGQAPSNWSIQCSDDGSTWKTLQSYTPTWSNASQTQLFAVPEAAADVAAGPHRYWRLLLRSSGRNAYAFAEVQFRTSPGTPRLFSGGIVSAGQTWEGDPGSAPKAADNDPATFWSSQDKSGVQFWQYDYGESQALDIAEVAITARNDSYYDQAPNAFVLQSSDDGTNWTTGRSFTSAPWTAGATQTFPASADGAPPVTATNAVHPLVMILA